MPLIHGQDPSGYLRPLLVDAAGNVLISGTVNANLNAGTNVIGKVDINTAPTLTVQSTQTDKLLAISVPKLIYYEDLALPVGYSIHNIYIVPANFRLKMTLMSIRYTGTVAGVIIQPYIFDGASIYVLDQRDTLISDKIYSIYGELWLDTGWTLYVQILGATLNDDFHFVVNGYLFHNT